MRSGWTTLRACVLSYPTSAPILLEWTCQEQRRCGLTASAPVPNFSAPTYTNGYGPSVACECDAEEQAFGYVVLQCPKSIDLPMDYARPDCSGWCYNRLAAQHQTRDRVRRSSGFQQLAQTTTTRVYSACFIRTFPHRTMLRSLLVH